MKSLVGVILAAILGLVFLSTGLAAAQAAGANDVAIRAPAASSAEAVRHSVEAAGSTYAGDCMSTRSPEDIGRICSKLVTSQDAVTAFETGPAFSEFNTWVFVVQAAGGWCVAGTTPFQDTPSAITIPWPAASSTAGC